MHAAQCMQVVEPLPRGSSGGSELLKQSVQHYGAMWAAGSVAGAVQCVVTVPQELLKIRMQARPVDIALQRPASQVAAREYLCTRCILMRMLPSAGPTRCLQAF